MKQIYKEVYPALIFLLIDELHKKYGYQEDFMTAAFLIAYAAAIGNSVSIRIKDNFIETPIIFCVLIGNPNTGKSHPLSFAFAPFFKKNQQLLATYKLEKEQYLENERKKKEDKANYTPLPIPVLKLAVMNDYTLESLLQALSNNSRGMLIYADELMGLIKNLNRYNSGSDLEAYLSLWSHKPIIVNRKHADPMSIWNPFCCIAGTIQTGIVSDFFGVNQKQNGNEDRWLKVMPDDLTVSEWNDEEIDPESYQKYVDSIETVFNISTETVLDFTEEARKRLIEWRNNEHRQQLIEDCSETYAGAHGKMDIYAARFALILQIMYWATGEATNSVVELRAVEGAIKLVNFFKAETEKVHKLVFDDDIRLLMTNKQKDVYNALPNTDFKTATGIKIASAYQMPERTLKRFLTNKRYFNCLSYGYYEKTKKYEQFNNL
jgi:hypothetical protein